MRPVGSYLRQVSVTDEISVSLVMAKSRVVPLKPPTSVPRMELAAAWTSAETATSVADELGIDGLSLYFWVDNMIVLGYIRNDKKRFRTYVANRSKKIRNITEKAAWGHVSTDLNPADDASRGLSVSEEKKVFRWFNGPDILWSPGGMSSQVKNDGEIPDDDPEVIVEVKSNAVQAESENHLVSSHFILDSFGERVSCWERMIKLLAALVYFMQFLNDKVVRAERSVVDLVGAEERLLKMIQITIFPPEEPTERPL